MSFRITTVSVARVLTFLPKRRAMSWTLKGLFGIANTVEVGLVTCRRGGNSPRTSTPLCPLTRRCRGDGISVAVIRAGAEPEPGGGEPRLDRVALPPAGVIDVGAAGA
jgi:hypothetical protein